MSGPPTPAPARAPGLAPRLGRLAVSAVALWAIWFAWSPAPPPLPEGIAVPGSPAALARLRPGSEFLIEGTLHPAAGSPRTWQGRFVYLRREHAKEDQLGARVLRTVEDARPAVRLRSGAGEWELPAGGYELRDAPRIAPHPWYARTQVNAGFRPGDPVVARGVVGAAGPELRALGVGPLAAYRRHAAEQARTRGLLVGAARVLASLFVVAYAASALVPPSSPASGSPARP